MAGVSIISTRTAVCASCGHTERLITATSRETISHCYVCGDTVTSRRVWQPGLPAPAPQDATVASRLAGQTASLTPLSRASAF